jgi:sacsin
LDEDARSFSELVICQFVKNLEFGTQITGKDKWWVAIEDLLPAADHLPDSSRRVMKNVECGLAALISSTFDPCDRNIIPPKAIHSRMFNTLPLPLPIYSDLPVHIHATFSLSGDRQSIAVDEYGAQSHGSEWNRYLLQDALPKLYLLFLDDIGTQVRQRVFEFWPQEEPPKRSCAELLCASFWNKLPESSRRLFPKAHLTMGLPQRRAAELLDINQAVFDFLPKKHSEILAALLISLEVKLVRHIPAEVAKHLKVLPKVKSVTGPMLRELFKSDRSKICLLKELAENPLILEVLFRQLIPADADLNDLDGCHLLPLADGSLATLKYIDTNDAQSSKYYVASEKELKLFDFASRYLVTSSTGAKLGPVLESGKFNLTRLRLCHVRKLLEMRPVVSTPNPEAEGWLTEFWKFWNGNMDSSLPSSNIDAFGAKVFRATRDCVDTYATPVEFQQLAAVVEPSVFEHQRLCDKIPGLYRFNTKFMPKSLTDNEKSFHKDISFYRFVRALRVLAGHTGVGTFVETHLDPVNIKVIFFPTKPKCLS